MLLSDLNVRAVYPGHPITIALAIVLKYPSLAAAEEKNGDFGAALGDSDIPGAGGCVRSALALLRYAQVKRWSWPQLVQWAAHVWATCDDQKTERPTDWKRGQDQADQLADELHQRVKNWGPAAPEETSPPAPATSP